MEKNSDSSNERSISEKYDLKKLRKLNKDELFIKAMEMLKDIQKLESNASALQDKILSLEKEVEVKKRLNDLRLQHPEYDSSQKGVEKVIYILKQSQKLLTAKEIEARIIIMEPILKYKWRNSTNASGRYLTRGIKTKRLVKYNNGGKFVYGLWNWFDSKGMLKDEFHNLI